MKLSISRVRVFHVIPKGIVIFISDFDILHFCYSFSRSMQRFKWNL